MNIKTLSSDRLVVALAVFVVVWIGLAGLSLTQHGTNQALLAILAAACFCIAFVLALAWLVRGSDGS